MKRKIISTITLLMLIAQMILPGIVNATNEGENKTGTDINNTQNTVSAANGDLEIGGNGSFGTLLADSINEQSSDESNNNQAGIINAEIDSNTATVKYYTYEKATIIVAIYNEEKNKLITSAKQDVEIAKQETETTIELQEELPEYFYLKVFMVDQEKNPLCDVYENPTYTKEMQKLLKMTIYDYNSDRVLNIDDRVDTNFAIYKEDTIRINAKESGVILKSSDNDNYIYVFENINDQIRNLKNGDILSYIIDESKEVIVKVSKIKIDGNSATITGEKTELKEIFDYIKIETNMEDAEVNVTETDDEGIIYNGTVTQNDELDENMFGDILDEEYSFKSSFTLKKEAKLESSNVGPLDLEASVKVEGTVELEYSVSMKFYMYTNTTHIEFDDDEKVTFKGAISAKISLAFPLLSGVDIIVPKNCKEEDARFVIKYTPKLLLEVSGGTELSVSYGSGKSIRIIGTKSKEIKKPAKIDVDDFLCQKISVFFGFEWNPSLKLTIIKDSFTMGLGAKFKTGILAKASFGSSDLLNNDDIKHDCVVCYSGDIGFIGEASYEANIELWKLFSHHTSIGYEWNYKITDFYYSDTFKEFAFTTCPHKKYKVTFKVVGEDGSSVKDAQVECNGKTLTTDDKGYTVTYLPNGNYNIVVKAGEQTAFKYIKVKDSALTKIIKFGDDFELGNPIKISYNWFGDAEIQPDEKGGRIRASYYDNNILKIECFEEEELPEEPYGGAYYEDWDYFKNNCKILIIEEGVEKITGYREWQNLKEVYLPSTLEIICSNTFNSCSNLEIIHWPDNWIKIWQYAFYNCSKLKELKDIKASLNDYSFADCTSLKEINITGWLGSKFVFKGCTNLEKVTINGSWEGSCYNAFGDCKLIKEIIINNTDDNDGIYGWNASSGYLNQSPNLIIDLTACEHPIQLTDWDLYSFFSQFSVSGVTIKCREDSYEEVHEALSNFYMLNNNMEEEILSDGKICIYPLKKKYPDVENKIIFYPSSDTQTNSYNSSFQSINTSNIMKSNLESTKSFTNLIPQERYLLCVMKNDNLADIFTSKNIVYIDQATADNEGNVKFEYNIENEEENIIVKLYGRRKAEDIENVSYNYLLGDVNGDGKVSLLDYGLVLAHVKRTKLLTGEQLERADVNGDKKVSLLDYGLILAHVKRTKLLF